MKKVLFAVIFVLSAGTVMAQATTAQSGVQEAQFFASIFHSQYGWLIGMGLGLYGLYLWLMSRALWGAILIVLGVAFTQMPELYSGMRVTFAPVAAAIGSGTGTTVNLGANPHIQPGH